MKRTVRNFVVCLLLLTLNLHPLSAKTTSTGNDFTGVAREATPAVVFIRVESVAKAPENSRYLNPHDLFGSDIFERFFGVPKEQQPAPAPRVGQGSGFLVSKDGHILTNSHVVDGADTITVLLQDGREFTARLIGQDPSTDLALIQVDEAGLPHLDFADSNDLEPGEWALAIGSPLGLQSTFTVGVVSATGRNNLSLAQVEDFIQTDAAINRGNSGGPLLNIEGKVIGVNTALVSNTGGYMGIGFAVPSNIAKHVMQQLLEKGAVSRGYLGVTMQQIDSGLAEAFGLNSTNGALVASILDDSPAAKAGLKQGDIIVKLNGKSFDGIGGLRNAIALKAPGTQTKLSVVREGKSMEIPVEIGTHPSSQAAVQKAGQRLGIEVGEITPEVAERLGHVDDVGVVITHVDPNGPAHMAGLRRGAVILGINQSPVHSVVDFEQQVAQIPEKSSVLMLVKQGKAPRFLAIKSR